MRLDCLLGAAFCIQENLLPTGQRIEDVVVYKHRMKGRLWRAHSEEKDDQNQEEDDMDEDDVFSYASLREAKNDKLGTPIPSSDFIAKVTADSENEFLKAMKDAKNEFAEIKEKVGNVDDAIDQVLDRIQREEELEVEWERETTEGNSSGNKVKGDNEDDAFQ